jgi:predicted nucleic acid-binding protein
MSDERPGLIDTNVLVYSLYPESERHAACKALLDEGQAGERQLCIVPQVIGELYAVITDSRRVTNPFTPEEALDVAEAVLAMPNMLLLPTPPDLVTRWISLARRSPVPRGGVFDFQLVATMLGNNVKRIFTCNKRHFEKFPELEVLTP